MLDITKQKIYPTLFPISDLTSKLALIIETCELNLANELCIKIQAHLSMMLVQAYTSERHKAYGLANNIMGQYRQEEDLGHLGMA